MLSNTESAAASTFVERLEDRRLFAASLYTQTNLVSDGAVAAAHTDADLKNPWGMAFTATEPFWISDNGTSKSTIYDANGVKQGLIINIPGAGGQPSAPTGQVSNTRNAFMITKGNATAPAEFIFVGEDGGITGWSGAVDSTNAVMIKDNSALGAVYKGVTIGTLKHKPVLYAADFHNNHILMLDSNFHTIHRKGAFADNKIPAGYAPFNIQEENGILFVTYAKQDADAHDDVPGRGHGFVDEFNTNGTLIRRLRHGSYLDSPWGIAIAPSTFGSFAGELLVGQFGSGRIAAINPKNGKFQGFLEDTMANPIINPGLWALNFGNDTSAGSSSTLFFTAGLNDEADGLFGSIALDASASAGGIGMGY